MRLSSTGFPEGGSQALVAHRVVALRRCVPRGWQRMSSSAPVKGTKAMWHFLVLGRGREAGVVLWQEELLEEAVGPGHVGDAGEPEFLGQALLQGAEHALPSAPLPRASRPGSTRCRAAPGRGRPGVGGVLCPDLAAGPRLRVPVVAAAVGVERAEQALGPDRLATPPGSSTWCPLRRRRRPV